MRTLLTKFLKVQPMYSSDKQDVFAKYECLVCKDNAGGSILMSSIGLSDFLYLPIYNFYGRGGASFSWITTRRRQRKLFVEHDMFFEYATPTIVAFSKAFRTDSVSIGRWCIEWGGDRKVKRPLTMVECCRSNLIKAYRVFHVFKL